MFNVIRKRREKKKERKEKKRKKKEKGSYVSKNTKSGKAWVSGIPSLIRKTLPFGVLAAYWLA